MGQDCPPHGTPEPSPVEHETQKQLPSDTSASETTRIRFYHRGTLGVNVASIISDGECGRLDDAMDNANDDFPPGLLSEGSIRVKLATEGYSKTSTVSSRSSYATQGESWSSGSPLTVATGDCTKLGQLCLRICQLLVHLFDRSSGTDDPGTCTSSPWLLPLASRPKY